MLHFKKILIAFLALTIITSCEKDENETEEISEKTNVIGKWVVEGTSAYESFEFNGSGNYIVVKNTSEKSTNNQIILFGTYELIDNFTVTLSDFGSLEITEITDNSMNFSVQLSDSPSNEIILNALKQKEIENTTKTELLCRTWELVSLNGENVEGTEDEITVLFSKAGTYFVTWYDGDNDLRYWKWKNEAENVFLYSYGASAEWDDSDEVEITELTENVLRMRETLGENEEILYVLKPIDHTKAMNKSSVEYSDTEGRLKSGLFKK